MMNELTIAPANHLPAEIIGRLEAHLLTLPQATAGVVHTFAPGLCIRQVTLPAGSVAIGHLQKTAHLNIMMSGRVSMFENGGVRELVAPQVFVGPPGRKVGFIHEETVWLNIYATDERDVEKVEAAFIDKSQTFTDSIPIVDRREDIEDFYALLEEFGTTEEVARAQSENTKDLRDFPLGSFKVKVSMSSIEGRGLFATAGIEEGEVIAPARLAGLRTPAGRYTNHAKHPNAYVSVAEGGDLYLVALRAIEGCRGGFDGEEITTDYRQAMQANAESQR